MIQAETSEPTTDQLGGKSIEEIVDALAGSDPDRLRIFLRRAREMFPDAVMRACLRYFATQKDPAKLKLITNCLGQGNDYTEALCDPNLLTLAEATRAAQVLLSIDPQFVARFARLEEKLKGDDGLALARALNLVPVIGDYGTLLSWLRRLTTHPSDRIRSKAVKLLCELKPNAGIIERQLESASPRVRANAIESLWHAPGSDPLEVFRFALADPHHRVVVNALVGLHLRHDESAMKLLSDLARHPSPMFRAAAVWAFGHLRDPQGIPSLQLLAADRVAGVRAKATEVLATFPPETDPQTTGATTDASTPAPDESAEPVIP